MKNLRTQALKLIFVAILVFLVVSQPASALTWNKTTVAMSVANGSMVPNTNVSYFASLALDPRTGDPRIAWGGYNPAQPFTDPYSWYLWPNMDLFYRNFPAGTESIWNAGRGSLNYAEYNGTLSGRWNNTRVDWWSQSTQGAGTNPSLKINSSGYARIVYGSYTLENHCSIYCWQYVILVQRRYAAQTRIPDGWSLSAISTDFTKTYAGDGTNPSSHMASLDLDNTGFGLGRVAGFWANSYPTSSSAYYLEQQNTTSWYARENYGTGAAGPSLAVSVTGDPRVVINEGVPAYYLKMGGVWYRSPVGTDVPQGLSLALDPYNEAPRVSYQNTTSGALNYAEWNGSAWVIETVDSSAANLGYFSSLAMDRWQRPHIAYSDITNSNLKYAVRDYFGVWHIEVVDSIGTPDTSFWSSANSYLSLALGGLWDNGRIAYSQGFSSGSPFNRYMASLKYADTSGLEYFNPNVIYGLVLIPAGLDFFAAQDSTVYIDNGTWSDSTTSDDSGVYFFQGLVPETNYTVRATKTSYVPSANYSVNSSFPGAYVRQDIPLGPASFTLNLEIRDSKDLSLLINKTVEMQASGILTATPVTTTGTYSFTNLPYGYLNITFLCSGYQSASWNFPMTGDRSETVYLDREQEATYQRIFYPHQVRLICQDPYGVPLSGVGVNVKGYNTTYANASWWQNIFGVDLSETNLFETMSGPTASDGSIVFLMSESVYYVIDLTYGTYTQQLTVYPKEDSYLIIMTPPGSVPFSTTNGTININYELSSNEVSTTQTDLRLNYTDSSSATTSVSFWVDNSSRSRIWSATYSGGTVAALYSLDTTSRHGETIYYGFFANHLNAGNITQMKTATIRSRLVEIGLDDNAYTWISIILLVLFTALFSGITSREGYILVPIIASVMWYIGWLNIGYVVMSGAIILGLLLYITKTQAVSEG
jgi:hypothetical protein